MSRSILTNCSNMKLLVEATEKPSSVELISDFSGRRLFNGKLWYNRWRIWIYTALIILHGFKKQNPKLSNLQDALVKTQQNFKKEIVEYVKSIEAHLQLYKTYLNTMRNNGKVDQWRVSISRHFLRSAYPIIKTLSGYPNCDAKIQEIYRTYLKNTKNKTLINNLPFYDASLYASHLMHSLREAQHIMDLEHGAVPIQELEALAAGTALSLVDQRVQKRRIIEWIKQIKLDKVGVRQLHNGLTAMINNLNRTRNKPLNVYELELKLTDLESSLFTEQDPKYRQWCWDIVDKSLPFPYKLGRQLGPKGENCDQHLVFEIENQPNNLLVFGANQSMLQIEKLRCERYKPSDYLPLIETVFNKEGYLIMQKLSKRITETEWASKDYPDTSFLTVADKKKADAIASMLKGFLIKKQTPDQLDPKNIFFDCKGKVKSLKPYIIGEKLDFQWLIECAKESAKGNQKILRYLLEESDITSHPIAEYYVGIVQQALSDDKISTENEAALKRITDPKVIKRAKNLKQEILDMRARCCNRIREKGSDKKREEVMDYLNENIKRLYQKRGLVSHIGSALEELIIEEFFKYYID